MIFRYLLCAVVGYLLGCFSTGILVARKEGHDIRAEGSHNTGASNALRVLGVKGGALTFLGDFLKAALAVMIGKWIAGQAGGCDRNALALCQELWESRGEGPDADNLIADKSIEYLLTRNGCEMHLYDGAHAREFSTLPSRSENRTIRPAIVERGTGTLVLRGLAAVREEDA